MKNQILKIFLLSSCMFLHVAFLSSIEIPWANDASKMNDIIDRYNADTLKASDPADFLQALDDMEDKIDALAPKSLKKYEPTYLSNYQDWKSYFIEQVAADAKKKADENAAVEAKKIAEEKLKIAAAEKLDADQAAAVKSAAREDLWIQDALAMYQIVEDFSQHGSVSEQDQEAYINILSQVESEINDLSPNDPDLAMYKETYVTPYKEWESYILAQEQAVEPVRVQSPEELQIITCAAKKQELLEDVATKIKAFGDEFIIDSQKILDEMQDYSAANVEDFYSDLDGAVKTFKSNMKSLLLNAQKKYASIVCSVQDQRSFINGINVMTERANLHIEAIALDLTVHMNAASFESQASAAFEKYDHDAQIGYENALAANRKLAEGKGWWSSLKNSGSRILTSFGLKMKDEVQKQAVEQVQKIAEEKGGELAKFAGEKAGEIGGAALAKIKDKASAVGGEAFDKLKNRAQDIGGETFANFKNKAGDFGGAAVNKIIEKSKDLGNETANKIKDAVVDELKKQATNQIGMDVDALAGILSGKDVSPEALRKVIIGQFPLSAAQKSVDVKVREGVELCSQENTYIENRLEKVEQTLLDDFGIKSVSGKPLRLAFSCSGGGNRAMIGTLGLFIGAAKNNFLDASMYLTGLSGSTWTIAPWSYMYLKGMLSPVVKDQKNKKEEPASLESSLQEFKAMLIGMLDYACPLPTCPLGVYPPNVLSADIQMAFSKNIAKHFAYDQPITAVDLWGALVADYALKKVGPDRLNIVWSSIAEEAQLGSIPLPLCSSVFDLQDRKNDKTGYRAEYKWFESGPFEAGSPLLGFIPVWALGSTFNGSGKIAVHAPEYELSEFLGVYGSAFALSVNDLVDKGLPLPKFKVLGVEIALPVDTWVRNLIDGISKDARGARSEQTHAQFANYSKGLEKSVLKDQDFLGMFDGGMYFNIPLPLLFDRPERKVDVVIMYDSNPVDLQCLVDASRYFAKNKSIVPNMENDPVTGEAVSKDGLLKRLMTVFNDPRQKTYNPKQPTLIYFPTPKTDISKSPYNLDLSEYSDVKMPIDGSKPPYTTANFKYTAADVENLSQTMEAIFDSQAQEMKKIVQMVAVKRSGAMIVRKIV